MEKTTKTLAQKLCLILGDCEQIQKKGRNTMQNYSYIREADVVDEMRKLLFKHGVFVLPTVEEITEREHESKSGGKMNFIRVKMKYRFINAENPSDCYESVFVGDGIDAQDKGVYKALTGCQKYMLLKTFQLGADDDPEKDSPQPRPRATPNGAQRAAPVDLSEPDDFDIPDLDDSQDSNVVSYKIPWEQKDQWKATLKDHGFRWNPNTKSWDGLSRILELEKALGFSGVGG